MSETKVVVPDGMLKAVQAIAEDYGGVSPYSERGKACYPAVLEAALLWLAENPIVPTDAQIKEMDSRHGPGTAIYRLDNGESLRQDFKAFQRLMFRAAEPEVPEAVDSDISERADRLYGDTLHQTRENAIIVMEDALMGAYRRGQRSK